MTLPGEIKGAGMISKHSLNINFLCIFFTNYWWVWEPLLQSILHTGYSTETGLTALLIRIEKNFDKFKKLLKTYHFREANSDLV